MKMKKILYATDFSARGQLALELASALAAAERATLLIVHVDDVTPGLVFGDVGYGFIPAIDEIARKLYDRLQKTIPTIATVPCEHRFLRGDAAEGILRCAEKEQVDLIVTGTHGKTGAKRLVMGSVAESLVRKAKCPFSQ